MRAVLFVLQLHLADARADAGDSDTVLGVELGERLVLGLAERDDVLDLAGGIHVDESRAVELETNGSERGELFECGLAIRRFVGKRAEEHLWNGGHAGVLLKENSTGLVPVAR